MSLSQIEIFDIFNCVQTSHVCLIELLERQMFDDCTDVK